jgi:hypothetical protein
VDELLFDFSRDEFYISGFAHALGPVTRTLEQLAREQLLASSVESLEAVGYRQNRSADANMGLLDLASDVFRRLLQDCEKLNALIVHHSYSVNTSEPGVCGNQDLIARASYFPASLLRHFDLDHIPYWGSHASGCTGFMSLLVVASAILRAESLDKVICLTADLKPPDVAYDSVRERLLTSDAASGFIAGRSRQGLQVMGVGQYSSSRKLIPLVEVVKRAVQMTRQLCDMTGIAQNSPSMLCHYPNMFLEGWQLVSHFLRVPKENQIIDGMAERAHCLSSDAIIPLERLVGTSPGRIHAVYSFGSGLHLAVAVLKEI